MCEFTSDHSWNDPIRGDVSSCSTADSVSLEEPFDCGTMNPDYDHPHITDESAEAKDRNDGQSSNPDPFGQYLLELNLNRGHRRKRLVRTVVRILFAPLIFIVGKITTFLRNRRRMRTLSPEKRYVLEHMTDIEVFELLVNSRKESIPTENVSAFEGDLKVDDTVMAKLKSYREKKLRLDALETRWFTTVESLLNCKYQKPQGFDNMTVPQIYQKLYSYLTGHHLPAAFVRQIVPELLYYIVNGELKRPLMLVGTPGCGKTTSGKIISDALGMVSYHFDAVTRDTSHGLFGEAGSFQSCGCGDLASGVCRTGVLNPVFIIDEPDKTSTPTSRTAFQDELLSLCDGTHSEYMDNFLGFPLPLKGVIIIFTANTTDTVSAPLLDRCEVIHFKDIEEARVQEIIVDYAESECKNMLYRETLVLDRAALHNAVSALYSHGVHSVRQHKKMVDHALSEAFNHFVTNREGSAKAVMVNDELFSEAIDQGEYAVLKRAGF